MLKISKNRGLYDDIIIMPVTWLYLSQNGKNITFWLKYKEIRVIQLQIKPKTHLNNYVSTIGNLHSFIWPCIMWYVFFSVCLVVFTRSVQISWPVLIRAFSKNRSGLWDVMLSHLSQHPVSAAIFGCKAHFSKNSIPYLFVQLP